MMKNKKGFTLIELLVVIAIIGLLSTLAVVSLNCARAKARDAKRTSDLRAMQSAIELYMADNNDAIFALPATWAALSTLLVNYLPGGAPKDPVGTNKYIVCSYPANQHYLLGATLENTPGAAGSGGVTSSGWTKTECRDEAGNNGAAILTTDPANCNPASKVFCLGAATR